MTVIDVLSALIAVFVFYLAATKLNTVSIQKYNYAPINGSTIAFNLLPFIMLAAGLFGSNKEESYAMALGVFFALLFIIGLGIYIYKKTSLGIALTSTFMIAIIGFAFILLVIMAAAAEESRCNRYDDDY
jgi:hypothetical protein